MPAACLSQAPVVASVSCQQALQVSHIPEDLGACGTCYEQLGRIGVQAGLVTQSASKHLSFPCPVERMGPQGRGDL